MNIKGLISSKRKITPTIYAYTTPTNLEKQGWVKIGYTERDADTRIKEQTQTVGITPHKLWAYEARFQGGGYFKDHDFHAYLTLQDIKRDGKSEWFYFENKPERSKELYRDFVFKDFSEVQRSKNIDYTLRDEQERAVASTLRYYDNNPKGEFLWNAKPRFGKTLASYDLVKRMGAENVLIVTNRPAIANSWFDDFEKFIAGQTNYYFVSESESLKDRKTLTREEYVNIIVDGHEADQIAFLSLQDLKGSKYFGGHYDKLYWVSQIDWDILIIDEAHEGVDTFLVDQAFKNIKRSFTLHLSGTPFKAIAEGHFFEDQIFNWSYADEQEAKEAWDSENTNPYEDLPRLNMFTYQMSQMITDEVNKGADIGNESNIDYAFDLNEFFSTDDSGKFIYERDVIKWLNNLTFNEKYPFSTEELRKELNHTFWVLERVDSAKALEKLLRNHEVFKNYQIIIAAGDGKSDIGNEPISGTSLNRVKEAIKENDFTITLSVGQLTTGVTIPEWTAVLMLSNMKSPSLYMQAAFRSQNPNTWIEMENGLETVYKKENAYVFDFAPERTLTIFDEFANNLISKTASGTGTTTEREDNIKRLLNFFPVIGEDQEGKMVELNASQVLTIPKAIKAKEVVKRGFMSNLLFANISGIFSAPQAALDILENLKKESQGRVNETKEPVSTKNVTLNEDNEPNVNEEIVVNKNKAIFGDKYFAVEEAVFATSYKEEDIINLDNLEEKTMDKIINSYKKPLDELKEEYKLTTSGFNKIKKAFNDDISQTLTEKISNYRTQKAYTEKEYNEKLLNANSDSEIIELTRRLEEAQEENFQEFISVLNDDLNKKIQKVTVDIITEQERDKERKKKSIVEEDVRSRLRGFARTIPSFLMAYGDRNLTLTNLETYVPDNVFEEVTGITIDQFRFLRDGGPYEEEGQELHFEGNLFDETVFNSSVQEFLDKKEELANYFEDNEEDIFDYIPPQETNQIFTPKNIVEMMVQTLEDETPGIFDDSSKTFIDIYMKSGLYITTIVKRLYNSEIIKKEIPDDEQRIKHILENQVYGFAPSEIIYNIAVNFIFGMDIQDLSRRNFVLEDTTPYAKEGKMSDLIEKHFGN